MIGLGGLVGGRAATTLAAETISLPFVNGDRPLVKYPQKRPLIRITTRPPQLETPFSVFNEGILTPNVAGTMNMLLAQEDCGSRTLLM